MNYAGKFDAALTLDGQGVRSSASDHVDSFAAKSFTATAHGHVPDGAVVISDPNLIFHGEFKRAGLDLVLSHDGHDFVVHDYFRGDKRAAIASPDGAHLTGDIVSALTGYVQVAQAAPGAAVAQVIGHVTKLTGSATVVRNGVSVVLNNGDNVEKGDVVSTGSDSTLGITFIDGTVFGLSSNARMVLNEMVYDPNGSNNSSLLSLVAGTITFVAGETAKHGDMKIDTPVATMGIRGTAVLTEINFVVPAGGGDPQPQANFQVLVEPNGTTGSYILFDKVTLLPIATVNQAGQMIQISGGNVSVTNALLSPDVQKLITDVFTLKFTDNNTNTKLTTNFTDSITQNGNIVLIKTPDGTTAQATFTNTVNTGSSPGQGGTDKGVDRIPGAPFASVLDGSGNVVTAFAVTEHAHSTGDRADTTGDAVPADTIVFRVNFVDQNLGDRPTVSVNVDPSKYTYTDSAHHDVTASLTALQKQDIAATQIKIAVVADGGNTNNGSAVGTYTIPDHAFDFLADGETLTLTYIVSVANNFSVQPETRTIPITITITGTNDKPVITTSVPTINFSGGTSVPGGPLTTNVPTTGTITFTDVDLTDTHTASVALTSATLPDGTPVPPGPLAAFQSAMSVAIAGGLDSTGTGTGTINWSLADLPVYLADFIPKGEVLTLVYTVTVADEHGATSQQTITVTITGTDAPAVVWIGTNQPSGGFWKDAANWETGTVPTSNDDVIVITDQLHGLTPSYPVTIDIAAFGKSLTMDDYDTTVHHTAPEVINHGTLTLGGKLTLNADAKFTNAADGTVFVGGPIDVETITRPKTGVVVTNTAAITNAGKLTLAAGGKIDTLTTIANSGMIELSGGTLTLDTGIANAGGTVQVDSVATLIADAVTIDGGTLAILGTLELDGANLIENGTLNNSGAVNVKGATELAHEAVGNSALGTIEVFADVTLTVDKGSIINNSGNVVVDADAEMILNGATISGGAVKGDGDIDVTGASTINGGATLSVATVTADAKLTLDGITVSGSDITDNSSIELDGTVKLQGGAEIQGGPVTNNGTLEISGPATLLNDTVTNHGTVQVDGSQTLNLSNTEISGGAINGTGTIDVTGASKIDGGATLSTSAVTADAKLTLDGITVSGSVITDNSSIELDHTVKLQGGAEIQGGPVTNNGTLEISGPATLLNDVVTNHGTVKVDGGQTLTLSGTEISGGTINGAGTIDVTGNSKIDGGATLSTSAVTVETGTTLALNTATVDGATISDKGSITIDGTVKLTGGAVIKGGSSVFAPNGGSPATVEFNWGQLGTAFTTLGSPQQVVATDGTGGTVSSAGNVFERVDQGFGWSGNFAPGTHLLWDRQAGPDITIKFATPVSSAGAQIQADYYGSFTAEIIAYDLGGNVIGTVTEGGVSNGNGDGSAIFIDLISSSADIAMVKFLVTSATYAPNDFAIGPVEFAEGPSVGNSGPIINNGTMEIAGAATLLNDIVTNHGTVTVDAGQTLTLSGTEIKGGLVTGAGTIDVTGSSAIDGGATLSASFVTVESLRALKLDAITVDGTTITDQGSVELDATVKLQGGARIQGGPITNNGTLEVAGAATLLNDIVTNHGTVQVDDGKVLTVSGTEISGGTINIYSGLSGGTIAVTGDSTIDGNATLNKGAVTIASGVTLILDDVTVSASKLANSGTVKVEADKKLTLAGATLTGGALTIAGTLASSGTTTVTDTNISNLYLLESTLGGLLTLAATSSTPVISNDGGTIRANNAELDINSEAVTNNGTLAAINNGTLKLISTDVTNTGGAVSIESGSTLDLSGATVDGGTVTIAGTLESTGTSAISNADITNTGTITVTGGTLTIDPAVIHKITNSHLIQANGGELDISSEQIVNTADLKAVGGGILKLTSLIVTNDGGTVTVDGASTLYLSDIVAINGGHLGNSGHIFSVSNANSISAAVTNTGFIEVQAGTLNLAGGLTGAGHLIIDDKATLELAGADAQAVTFAGGADTLQLNNTSLGFTGTITGQSSTGGTFTITGNADITTSSGDALDFTASGGASGSPANIVLTPTGTLTGAANGVAVTQSGTGDISLSATGDITGLAGNGITLRDSSTGVGDITVNNVSGTATGTGANSEGILVQNLNAANAGNISIIQLDGAVGGAYGIDARTQGNGDITIDAGGNVTGSSIYGIRARSYGAGNETVKTEAGSVVTSASSGIVAVNRATSIDAAKDSTITVNAFGTINSGSSPNENNNTPAGIQAGYTGATTDTAANTNVNGSVTVNNHANITSGGHGIHAYNFGNGDVTVNDGAGTTVTGAVAGIKASAGGGGTGDVSVNIGANAHVTGTSGDGIDAFNQGVGAVTVTTGADSSITAAGTAINAFDLGGGDISVTNEGSATGASGLTVSGNGAGTITIANDGHITGTSGVGIGVTQALNATGQIHITNDADGHVVGADGMAAIAVNAGSLATALIDNSGTIGPDAAGSVTSTTYAIAETGGAVTINNSGHINGNISVASATFDNKAAGTWTVSGTSVFGTLSKIDNVGEIDLHDGASVSSADGVTFDIANSGKIESWGTASITGHISNTNTIEIHADGTLSLFGSLSGSGSVTIDTGATLVVDAAVSQTVTFDGTGAELAIHTTTFGGSIAGLASTDKIDLSSIDYGSGTSAAYVANADASTGGTLTISDAAGHHISLTLTGADYSHAVFAGSDDGAGHTLITVNAADDAPKFTTDGATLTANVSELADTTGVSTTYDPSPAATGSIDFKDVDLTDRPTATITHQDVTWLAADHTTALTLTPDEISALEAALSLQLTGKNNGSVGWSYSIADGTLDFLGQGQTATVVSTVTLDDGHKTDTAQVTVTITGANDAPTLDNATLAATSEDTAAPAGSTVGKLFAAGFHDVDDGASLKAVAITADHATASQGVWQYEVAGSNQWIDISGVSDTGALVLAADTLIRFVPAANYSGAPGSLDVHALDDAYAGGTSGDTPVLIDITSSAIGSSVSAQPATLDTEVTPVADPPAFKALAVNYVADSLTGDSIDLTKWQVVLPSVPGTADDASVTPTANGVVLHDHGYLETTSGFTPTAATPLHVSLSFSLDDGIGPYVAVTDGTDGRTGAYGSPANGLSFMFGWGHGLVIANNATGQSVDLSAGLSQGTVYDATITDDGSHQTVAIVDHSTGQTVGTYTSDFTDHAAGDLVTITNREANDSQHDATISNVTISNAFEGEHGVPIALSGLTALTDTDGSEQMSLDLSGFPDGTTFSVGQPGTGAEAGHWLISAADIASLGASALTMTAPADYAGEFSLNVSGTVVDQATGLSGPLSDTKTFTSDVAVKVDGGGPVIDTTHFVHTHNEDGTDALTDLSVSGSATETYSLSAVTAGASDGSSVSPCQDDGASLDQINTDLASVTYSPGQSPPANDMITLTVTDSAGIKDTVNFIFNEGGEGPVTLDGTTGKDVIFATTTNDTLTGGGGKDQFVFAPSGGGDASHTITDFIEGLDKIDLRQFSDVSSIADLAIAQQQGTDDTLVSWHQQISHGEGGPVTETEQLLLKSVIAANLKASDFIFHIT